MKHESTLNKIESNLPDAVKNLWLELVMDQELQKKPAATKYEALMKFLDKAKGKSEYKLSENETSVRSSTKYCVATGKSFHVNTKEKDKDKDNKDSKHYPCFACSDGSTNPVSYTHLTLPTILLV